MRTQGKGNLRQCWRNRTGADTLEISVEDSQKANIIQLRRALGIFGVILRDSTSYSAETYAAVSAAALITTVRKWKRPRCPPTDGWIMKVGCIYRMECYSAVKKNIQTNG